MASCSRFFRLGFAVFVRPLVVNSNCCGRHWSTHSALRAGQKIRLGVIHRWQVNFLVAILLLARWFGGEMTINGEGQNVTVILPPNHLATNEISTKRSTHHHIQLFQEGCCKNCARDNPESRGQAKDGIAYGPLTDLPDWSYADGTLAPETKRRRIRRFRRLDVANQVKTYLEEMEKAAQRRDKEGNILETKEERKTR